LADSRSTVLSRLLTLVLVGLSASGCGGSTDSGGGGTGNRPASLQIVSGDVQVAAVGTELPAALVVRVLDAAGAPVAGQAINFRVVAGGGTTFAGVGTTNSNGMAQERWTMGTTPGPQRLEARAVDSATGVAIVYGTFTATAVAGPPATVAVLSGDGQNANINSALANPIVVRVADSYGNLVSGVQVHFVVTSGGGAASPAAIASGAGGTASSSWTLGPLNGAQTLEAQVSGVQAVVLHATALGDGYLRIANLSPDLGAIDFCIGPSGAPLGGPIMAHNGAANGIVYGGNGSQAISRYFQVPFGIYDILVVEAGLLGAGCSNPLLTLTGFAIGVDEHKLLAVVGASGATGAPHSVVSFTDEHTVASNRAAIRFINAGLRALPGSAPVPLPALNIGFTIGSTYSGVFTNVAYPGTAPAGGVVDANGYANLDPAGLTAGAQITACPYPAIPPSSTCSSSPMPPGITGGTVASGFIIGYAGVAPNSILCADNTAPPTAGYNYSLCAIDNQTSDVAVYWEFDRNTFVDGIQGTIRYDANVNWPPGTGSRACPQSGVDFVTVSDLSGNLLTGSVPCVNQSVQGAVVTARPGANTYVITGWRTGHALPLYRGLVTISVVNGVTSFGTAIAVGIPDVLAVDAILADANAPLGYATCGLAGIQRFDAWIEDGFGTLVWRNPVPCGLSDVPGVSFGSVDRDNLVLWMDAWDLRPVTPAIIWSKCGFAFPHFAGSV